MRSKIHVARYGHLRSIKIALINTLSLSARHCPCSALLDMLLCVIASFRLTISDRCSVDTDGRIGPASGTETVWEFEFSVNSDVTVM